MNILTKLLSFFFILILVYSNIVAAELIPLKSFFVEPNFISLKLAPNGKYLAVLTQINKRRNLILIESGNLSNARPLTGLKDYDIAGYVWANDDTIIFFMDATGVTGAYSLYKVNINGTPEIKMLVGATSSQYGVRRATIVNSLINDPDHIIVEYNRRKIASPDLYKLPIDSSWHRGRKKNSEMERIAKNPGDVVKWIVDHDGDVRGAFSIKGLNAKLYYKNKLDKEFTLLREYRPFEEGIAPIGFDFDNKKLFVTSNIGRDTSAIYRFDPETNKLGELIYGRDDVDVDSLTLSRDRKKILAANYYAQYPHKVYFDEEYKSFSTELEKAFIGKDVLITSKSRDEKLYVIFVTGDRDPGNYYLYNKKTRKLTLVYSVNSLIKPEQMSEMIPFKFVSRDGLDIHGYITIPLGSDGKNLPIILKTIGVFGRYKWGFRNESQFFASRGYATVHINNRVSTGYGKKFYEAGIGQLGLNIQNDITGVECNFKFPTIDRKFI